MTCPDASVPTKIIFGLRFTTSLESVKRERTKYDKFIFQNDSLLESLIKRVFDSEEQVLLVSTLVVIAQEAPIRVGGRCDFVSEFS